MSALSHSHQLVAIRTGTYSAEVWEGYRAEISELYASHKLKEVMEMMKHRHSFEASLKKWKTMIGKWGLDTKNIKQAEYLAISRKKRKREEEYPGRATQWILNGSIVPEDKIQRFEARQGKKPKKGVDYEDAPTPPTLRFRTPSLPPDEIRASEGGIDAVTENFGSGSESLEHITVLARPSPRAPQFFSNVLQSLQPDPNLRVPSLENCDWFSLFVDYSRYERSSPIPGRNGTLRYFLPFGKHLTTYQEEFALRAFLNRHKLEKLNYLSLLKVIYSLSEDPEIKLGAFDKRAVTWLRAIVAHLNEYHCDVELVSNSNLVFRVLRFFVFTFTNISKVGYSLIVFRPTIDSVKHLVRTVTNALRIAAVIEPSMSTRRSRCKSAAERIHVDEILRYSHTLQDLMIQSKIRLKEAMEQLNAIVALDQKEICGASVENNSRKLNDGE